MRTIISKRGTSVETTVEVTRPELDAADDRLLRGADRVRLTDEDRTLRVEQDAFGGDVYFVEDDGDE